MFFRTQINGLGYWSNNNNKLLGRLSVEIVGNSKFYTLEETTIHFSVPTEHIRGLCTPEIHRIEIRELQSTNPLQHRTGDERYVLVMETLELKLGSIEELRIKVCSVEGHHREKRILMLDPMNHIWEINGVDYMKKVRELGGIE